MSTLILSFPLESKYYVSKDYILILCHIIHPVATVSQREWTMDIFFLSISHDSFQKAHFWEMLLLDDFQGCYSFIFPIVLSLGGAVKLLREANKQEGGNHTHT